MSISPIVYAVYKVLPLVYDNSLSYYEVLSKVADKCNELINQVNTNTETLTELTETLDDTIREMATEIIQETLTPEYIGSIISESYLDDWLAGNATIEDLQTDVNALKTRCTNIETVNNTQSTNISALQTRATNIENVNNTQNTNISALQTRATNIENKNTQQDTNIGNNTTAINGIKSDFVRQANAVSARSGYTIENQQCFITDTLVVFTATITVGTQANNPTVADSVSLPYRTSGFTIEGVCIPISGQSQPTPTRASITTTGGIQLPGVARVGTYMVHFVYPKAVANANLP